MKGNIWHKVILSQNIGVGHGCFDYKNYDNIYADSTSHGNGTGCILNIELSAH